VSRAPQPTARVRPVRRDLGPRLRLAGGILLLTVAVAGGLGLASAARVTSPVLVAAADLEPGSVLTADRVRPVQARLDPEQAALILTPDDLAAFDGHYLRHHVSTGEPLVRSVFGRVPRSSRLFSFVLERADAVAGRIRPGDTVDVVASSGSSSDACTKVVAAAVTVVDIADAEGGPARRDGVEVTLEVAPADVVAVTHARATGTITLALASGAVPDTRAEAGSCGSAG